jgi:hypothetical protein
LEIPTQVAEDAEDGGKNWYKGAMKILVVEIVSLYIVAFVLFGVVDSSKGQIQNVKQKDFEGRIL